MSGFVTGGDIEWMKNLVATVRDGGVWGVPRSGSVYRFDRATKTATLEAGPGEACITDAFNAIGWEVAP